MKKLNSILWGIFLIVIGVVIALKALNLISNDIFFDGWWTLFIIIPCSVGLITEREKTGNLIGAIVGVFLLLSCQNIITFSMLWKILVPAIIIIIGIKLVLAGILGNRTNDIIRKLKAEGKTYKRGNAIFSSCNLNYDGEVFEGAELLAVFGSVKCDLRDAIIEKDCAISVSSIFGDIDILVPNNVNVIVNSSAVFGGITNKTKSAKDVPTLYINGTCFFAGVEIK